LIASADGFDVYGPRAGAQLGFVEPIKLSTVATRPSYWLAFGPSGRPLTDSRHTVIRFRTRKAAAEALLK
jgi:hypothetical protein